MTTKILLSILVAGGFASPVMARQLSPSEALALAMRSEASLMHKAPFKASPVKVGQKAGINTYYIYNNPSGGYIIAAADDVAIPMLGYSDSGAVNPDNIPVNMQSWLDFYSDEIAWAVAAGGYAAQSTITRADHAPIAPMVSSRWNQSAPYNNLCPTVEGKTSVTGCSATAMAQIMNFWKYPSVGTGSNEYSYDYNGSTYTWSMNFASTSLDWSNMLDSYSGDYTPTQATAVATLMKACGISINSSYTSSSTGASINDVASALLNNFNYGQSLAFQCRDYYRYNDWTELVYNELSAGRPVYYTGHNTSGHAFVCDGYSSDGYFHINWGWGGTSDGYYLLSALDPTSQGIGGSNAGYNAGQEILTGIAPSTIDLPQSAPQMRISGDVVPEAYSYTRSSSTKAKFVFKTGDSQKGLWNYSTYTISGTLGFKVVDTNGNTSYITIYNFSDLKPSYGWYSFEVTTSKFPVGTYTITPAFMVDDKWYDVLTIPSASTALIVTVTASTVKFKPVESTNEVEVTGVTLNAPLYIGEINSFTASIKATGEYYGELTPMLLNSSNNIVAKMEAKNLTILDGDTRQVTWIGSFSPASFTAGDYTLAFVTPEMKAVPNAYKVSVSATPAQGSLSTGTITVSNPISGAGTRTNPYIIAPDQYSVSVPVSSSGGYFSDIVKLGFFNALTGYSELFVGSQFLGLEGGQSKTLTFSSPLAGLDKDNLYMLVLWGDNKRQLSPQPYTYVKIGDPVTTGIDNVVDNGSNLTVYPNPVVDQMYINGLDTQATVAIYSLGGAIVMKSEVTPGESVDLSMLAPGDYIAVIDEANGNHSVKQIIKQ